MDELKLCLPFPPSSNMAYPDIIVWVKGKPRIKRVLSERMNKWIKSCPYLKDDDFSIGTPVFIKYTMFWPDDRVRDGQSYLKPVLDYIVKQHILPDDNRRHVKGEMWWDGGIDHGNPRVEIQIKTLKEWN